MKSHPRYFPIITALPLLAILAFGASSCFVPVQGNDNVVVQNYVPPAWAPPYDNVSEIRYYYLPDYEVYYDVWGHQFWYLDPDGAWVPTDGPPPACDGANLSSAFVVLIDRDIDHPWEHHEYYRDNYPRHGYDQYTDIVVHNRIVTNTAPGHELVARAFNENTNRVTFMQRPVQTNLTQPPPSIGRPVESGQVAEPSRGNQPVPPASVMPTAPTQYHHVVHEVPMQKIAPSMPAESQNRNYGTGYSKARAPQATSAPVRAPQATSAPARAPQTRAPQSAPQGGGQR